MAQPVATASKVTIDLQEEKEYNIEILFNAISSGPVLLYEHEEQARHPRKSIKRIKNFKDVAHLMFCDFVNSNNYHAAILHNPGLAQLVIDIGGILDEDEFCSRFTLKGLSQKQENYFRDYVEKSLIPFIGKEEVYLTRPESPVFGEEKKKKEVVAQKVMIFGSTTFDELLPIYSDALSIVLLRAIAGKISQSNRMFVLFNVDAYDPEDQEYKYAQVYDWDKDNSALNRDFPYWGYTDIVEFAKLYQKAEGRGEKYDGIAFISKATSQSKLGLASLR